MATGTDMTSAAFIQRCGACLLSITLALSSLPVWAAHKGGDFMLKAPTGFVGPVTLDASQDVHVLAYSRDRPEGEPRTLLQISYFDLGEPLSRLDEEGRQAGARFYAMQFLKGVERLRNGFHAGEPIDVRIEGHPAARVAWTGMLKGERDGTPAHGVMTAVLVGTVVYVLHVQDVVDAPAGDMQSALLAVDQMSFNQTAEAP